jgi:hypothetical protein
VNAAIEDDCNVITYALTKPQVPSKHNAFLAVLTCRLSLLPENNPGIAPATSNPGNPDFPSDSDKTQLETAETTKNSPISATPALFINTFQQIPTQNHQILNSIFQAQLDKFLHQKHPYWTHKNKTSHQLPKISQITQHQ